MEETQISKNLKDLTYNENLVKYISYKDVCYRQQHAIHLEASRLEVTYAKDGTLSSGQSFLLKV